MIDINLEKNLKLYTDYEECIKFLSTINEDDYSYPDEPVNFHIYSEIRTPKEAMAVKSYFATQNLEKTNLILWSDYEIKGKNKWIAPFEDMIDMRVYNPIEEAKETLIEGKVDILKATDQKHYLQSDLMRILTLHKYGGVFIDMDIILLRDFKPILDQEYMYMWGSETDFEIQGACATVLSMFKESEFSRRLLEGVITSPIWAETTCWGKDMFARVYKDYKYQIFPSPFFNTEWCINVKYQGKADQIQETWFDSPIESEEHLFLDAFAWHWHNTSWKHKKPRKGSKFYLLEEMINKKLEEKGIEYK